ncbi:MAG: cyclodeaminase/cyclohydrolase family protein [Spirochaetes bacterium]|nr:cyclodeaminase/cyclohydrolase family protein [Spirochaetota bacterium]
MGASLVAMVGNLGAPRGADSRRPAVLGNLAMKAQGLKTELLGLVDEDTKAFDAVLAAARLPKVTEVEIRTRSAALDVAYKEASRVPLAAAGVCLEVLRLCRQVVELGRKSSATDGAVGALVARAGLEGAILNVQVNLPSISDEAFTKACLAEASKIATEASKIGDEIKDLIAAILIV